MAQPVLSPPIPTTRTSLPVTVIIFCASVAACKYIHATIRIRQTPISALRMATLPSVKISVDHYRQPVEANTSPCSALEQELAVRFFEDFQPDSKQPGQRTAARRPTDSGAS